MPIRIECPSCGRTGSAPDGSVGRAGKCPACGTTFTITIATVAATPARSPLSRPVYDVQSSAPPAAPACPAVAPAQNQTNVYVNQPPSNDLGVAGFAVSLIGFLTCGCLSPLGLVLSLAGLSREPRGLAIAGTVLGGIGSLWILGGAVLVLLGIVSVPHFGR